MRSIDRPFRSLTAVNHTQVMRLCENRCEGTLRAPHRPAVLVPEDPDRELIAESGNGDLLNPIEIPQTTGFTVAFMVLAAAAPPRIGAAGKSPSDVAFERLTSLVGTWQTREKGSQRSGTATYTLTGGGKVGLRDVRHHQSSEP